MANLQRIIMLKKTFSPLSPSRKNLGKKSEKLGKELVPFGSISALFRAQRTHWGTQPLRCHHLLDDTVQGPRHCKHGDYEYILVQEDARSVGCSVRPVLIRTICLELYSIRNLLHFYSKFRFEAWLYSEFIVILKKKPYGL